MFELGSACNASVAHWNADSSRMEREYSVHCALEGPMSLVLSFGKQTSFAYKQNRANAKTHISRIEHRMN